MTGFARHTPLDGADYTDAKIFRKGLGHLCWPPPSIDEDPEIF